jgi:hypothetical protein
VGAAPQTVAQSQFVALQNELTELLSPEILRPSETKGCQARFPLPIEAGGYEIRISEPVAMIWRRKNW